MAILSSALDGWCSVALKRLDMPTAKAAIAERLEITKGFDPHRPRQFLERFDAVHMSCELGCILGRFDDALSAGRVLDELGRGRGIISGGSTQLAPALFFGRFDQCLQQVSGAYAEALQRPGTGNSMLLRAFCCAAAVCGYRGDQWPRRNGGPVRGGGQHPAPERLLHQNDAGRRALAPRPAVGGSRINGRATFILGVAVAGLVRGGAGRGPWSGCLC